MLFTQLFQELQYCATQKHKHEGQRLPVPCRFIMDEFANTCTIPQFVKILAYARSFGIGITPILQSLEQIKNMYKDEWGVIVDNCNTLLYLGSITHMDTLEYMSKLLGKGTFDKKTTGRTRGRSGSSSENFDVVGRDLMDSAEVRKLPKKNCLLIVGGRNPFYSEKYEYESHPNYRFTSDANKEYSFHHIPAQPPVAADVAEVDSPHREESVKDAPVKDLKPSENAKVSVSPIKMEESGKAQLVRISKNAKNLEPIGDEFMVVDDGENNTAVIEKTLEALIGEEEAAKERAKLSVSEETKAFLEEARARKIRIEENLLVTVNRLGRTFRNLVPIADELMLVDDGENEAIEEIVDKMMEFVLDDSNEIASQSELDDVLADAAEMLKGLFDENPDLEV